MNERIIKKSKRISFLILALVFTFIFVESIGETSIPEHTKNFYVNDFGNVFSPNQIDEMMDRAVKLAYKDNGIQVVVSTVETLNGLTIEDYANLMYEKYGIGKDDKGILILLSKKERKIRVEVGYGLESYITDSKAGKFIQDYAISYLKNNQFDLGLMNLQKAFVNDLDKKFESPKATEVPVRSASNTIEQAPEPVVTSVPVTRSSTNTANETKPVTGSIDAPTNKNNDFSLVFIIATIGFAVLFIVEAFIISKQKKKYNSDCEDYERRIHNEKANNEELIAENRKLNSSLESQENSYNKLSKKYDTLKDRFNRASKLHEGLDLEIDRMIQKEIDDRNREIAAKFDSSYGSLSTLEHLNSYQAFGSGAFSAFDEQYKNGFNAYDALSSEQRKYVKTDMREARRIYNEGLLRKSKEDAEEYNNSLKECTSTCSATESNLRRFLRLWEIYNTMDSQTKSFVDSSLISSLNDLTDRAEAKKQARLEREAEERRRREEEEEERRRRRREEEEEERRRQQDSWSSSFSDSSSFGGFGGDSGGGGASASF
ncbi:MAG: TPM domain-containing protein [Clostridia bacterium]|nr:TPM domain-containing protein [Clostridia bacterium]